MNCAHWAQFHGAGQSTTTLLPVLHRGAAAADAAARAAPVLGLEGKGGRGPFTAVSPVSEFVTPGPRYTRDVAWAAGMS